MTIASNKDKNCFKHRFDSEKECGFLDIIDEVALMLDKCEGFFIFIFQNTPENNLQIDTIGQAFFDEINDVRSLLNAHHDALREAKVFGNQK